MQFSEPPVVETVLGIQFAPMAGLSVLHMGLFWHDIRDEYPKSSLKEPIGPPSPPIDSAQIPLRAWFHDADDIYLVQLQFDRLVFNWRKREEGTYPHYHVMRPRLVDLWGRFIAFCGREGLGTPRVILCEVTYVDHIPLEVLQNSPLAELFPFWRGGPVEYFPESHLRAFSLSLDIPGTGEFVHVQAQPFFKPGEASVAMQLHFTSVRNIVTPDDQSLFAALDAAQDLGFTAFVDFTSDTLHRLWGKKE